MKIKLLIFFLLVSFWAYSQPSNYVNSRTRNRSIAAMFDSSLHIPVYCGVPSGLRVGSAPNDGALAIDTCNNNLYLYSGAAWIRANIDTAGKFITAIYKNATNDSLVYYVNGSRYALHDRGGGGGAGGGISELGTAGAICLNRINDSTYAVNLVCLASTFLELGDSSLYVSVTRLKDSMAVARGLINGKLSNITGLVTPGTNVTITGSGTSGSPYVINSSGSGGSLADTTYGRNDSLFDKRSGVEFFIGFARKTPFTIDARADSAYNYAISDTANKNLIINNIAVKDGSDYSTGTHGYRNTTFDLAPMNYVKGSRLTDSLNVIRDSIAKSNGAIPYTWIFVSSGQSNMWGANDANQLDTVSNSRILIWNHAETTPQWRIFRINQRPLRSVGYNSADGGNSQPGYNGSNNHLFYFAKKWAKEHPNDTVKTIMAIGDGSGIQNWWGSGVAQKYLDSITTRMDAANIDHVDGFIWDQGEYNTSAFSGIYKESFDSIKATLRRKSYFSPATPIVVVGMPQLADGADASYVGMDTLLRWMDKGDDLWVGYARTDGLVIDNNAVHFDTTSLKIIGEQRIYQAFNSLPHRFAELYDSARNNVDSAGLVGYDIKSGTITTDNKGNWTMANLSYMTDTTHYIVGDGYVEWDISNFSGIPVVGLRLGKVNEYYTDGSTNQYYAAAYANSANIVYLDGNNNTGGAIASRVNVSKIKIQRIGSVIKMYIKVKDFYSPFYTYSGTSTDTLWVTASASGASVLKYAVQNIIPGNAWTKTQTDIIKETGGIIVKGLKTAPGTKELRIDDNGNFSKYDINIGGGVSNLTIKKDSASYAAIGDSADINNNILNNVKISYNGFDATYSHPFPGSTEFDLSNIDFGVSNNQVLITDTFYILATGQSNLWGATGASQYDSVSSEKILAWDNNTSGSFVRLKFGAKPLRSVGYNSVDGGNTHPEWNGSANEIFYFAKKYLTENPNTLIKIIFAVGDGSSQSNWFSSGVKQKYLDSCISRVIAAGVPKIDMFIYHQGENNTSGTAGQFKLGFDSIKAILRSYSWFPKTTPIVVVGMPHVEDGADVLYTGMDNILKWMDYGDDPWVGYVETGGLSIANNAVHFSDTSLYKIGYNRMWKTFNSIPKRISELWGGINSDTLSFIEFNKFNGAITKTNNSWNLPANSYMTDTANYIVGDGYAEFHVSGTSGIVPFGLNTTADNVSYENGSIYNFSGTYIVGSNIYYFNEGDVNTSATAVIDTTNISAIRIQRTGNVLKLFARIKDSYFLLTNFSTTTTDTLYIHAVGYNSSILSYARKNINDSSFLANVNGVFAYKKQPSGTGVVKTIGITTANGVSGSSSGGVDPRLTVTLGAISPTSVNGVSSTEIGYVAGVTSSIQTQINNISASGQRWKTSVAYATTAALPASTYNNGTAGVGATLTANTVGILTIGGHNMVLNDDLLIKNQASGFENGVYVVTTEGTAGVAYVLTRRTDYDQTGDMGLGDGFFIVNGTVNTNTSWSQTTSGTITVGTTNLIFAQIAGPGSMTATLPLRITGVNHSIDDATTTTKGVASFDANDFNVGTGAVTIDYTNWGGLNKSNNLSDVSNATTARTNINAQVSGSYAATNAANTYSSGFKQTFSPSATTSGLNLGSFAGDPSILTNGDTWYNSTTNKFRARENGVSIDIIGSGGGNVTAVPTPTSGQAAEWTGATTIQGIGVTGTASYVKSTGATLNSPLLTVTSPATPAAGNVVIYGGSGGAQDVLAFKNSAGQEYIMQEVSWAGRHKMWQGTYATAINLFGSAAALTAIGTATAAGFALTNNHTKAPGIEYLVTAASATAVAGFREANNSYWFGNAADDGGFSYHCTFGPATGVATTTSRLFIGMSTSTAAPTDVEPSSLLNMLGVGYDAADANLQFMRNDGSGTATKIDLGANFVVPTTDRTALYRLDMYVAPNSTTVNYRVTNLVTGNSSTGSVSTDLPAVNTAMSARGYTSVGGTSSVIGIALKNLTIDSIK